MLGSFFRRSTDHKQRVNKKQNFLARVNKKQNFLARVNKKQNFLARVNKKQNLEIDCSAPSGGQRMYVKYVSFPWSPLEEHCKFLTLAV
jgi:hypothetical protein